MPLCVWGAKQKEELYHLHCEVRADVRFTNYLAHAEVLGAGAVLGLR